VVAGIEKIAAQKPGIDRINELLTMHLGPKDVLLTLSLDFADKLTSGQVETTISELETAIKSAYPEVTRVFIEAQSWRGHQHSEAASRLIDAPDRQQDAPEESFDE
jgi:divalent metal cation (Fe/Co/Zn/Cd) transporter